MEVKKEAEFVVRSLPSRSTQIRLRLDGQMRSDVERIASEGGVSVSELVKQMIEFSISRMPKRND